MLAAFPRFADLDPEAMRAVSNIGRIVVLPSGTVLFHDQAECKTYLLVLTGAIRVQKVAETGREIVLYRVERGQSCVLTTNCLLARQDYTAEAIAEADVRALVLPAACFRDLLAKSAVFREFVFTDYAERVAGLLLLIEEVAFGRMDMRLAAWLVRHGNDGDIHATHQEIAAELGSAREVVSRQLKEFERRQWVELSRGRIRLMNSAGLRHLAEPCVI